MPAELLIYDIIGGCGWWDDDVITGETVSDFLKEVAPSETELNIRLNTPGGAVSEGLTILNYVNAWKAQRKLVNPDFKVRTIVDGFAYSAGSVILMAGDERIMNIGTTAMIHKAWTFMMANADEVEGYRNYLNKIDGELANIYTKYAGSKPEEWLNLMKAETYFTPSEALTAKLITSVDEAAPKPNDKHKNFSNMQPGAYGRTMTTVAMQRFKGIGTTKPENRKIPVDPMDAARLREARLFQLETELEATILAL